MSALPADPAVVLHAVTAAGLVLEPQVSAHAAELFPVLSDPALYTFEHEPPESEAWLAARFARLESRRSADGTELWLNWVIRLADGAACGFVQATVLPDGRAVIAYVLGSPWWGRGIARTAVSALLDELESRWAVHHVLAVLQAANLRSAHLLERLGFGPATPDPELDAELEPGEAAHGTGEPAGLTSWKSGIRQPLPRRVSVPCGRTLRSHGKWVMLAHSFEQFGMAKSLVR